MRKIKMGLIGLGSRGKWWLEELLKTDDVEVISVCDTHEDRMEAGRAMCAEKYGRKVAFSGRSMFGSTRVSP